MKYQWIKTSCGYFAVEKDDGDIALPLLVRTDKAHLKDNS
ncbi:hypothetical protein J2T59_001435 [Methanosalsum natronophilum]|nr:hypothetical protein [Methanosalsum natronophilum]